MRTGHQPLRQAVLDVIKGRVDEDTRVVPGARFDTDGLVNETGLREVSV
jgi:hypothetical protein